MKRKIFILLLFLLAGVSAQAIELSLDSCKAMALRNNRRITESRLRIEASEKVKDNAFTKYFPNISAGALAMQSDKCLMESEIPEMNLPVYDGNPANLQNPTQFTYFPGMKLEMLDYTNVGFVSAIQPIYTGGRVSAGNELAGLATEINRNMLELSIDETLVKTEDYYWQIVALQEKQKTLESYEKMLVNMERDVKAAYEAGLVQKSDLLKVQLEKNKIKMNRMKLDNGICLLNMAMAQLIGLDYSETNSINDSMPQIFSPDAYFIQPGIALNSRPEYKMLNKAIEAELLQKEMERGEYLPQLAIGGQYMYMDVMDQQNGYFMGFATISVPISDWWSGSYKMEEHDVKIEIARNNMEEKSELLKLQIEKTYKEFQESYHQIEVAKLSESQAEEHLKAVSDNYEAGIVSTSDMLEARAMRQQAHDSLIDAQTVYMIKRAYYMQAIAKYE